MQPGYAAGIAAADADPAARQRIPVTKRARQALPWLAIGTAAYLVTLIATVPARFVVTPGPRRLVAGTVWSGEAVVDGIYRVQWRWAPWRSLARLAFAADMRLSGGGTDLAGAVAVSPSGYRFDGLAGDGDGGLLATFGPPLPFACTTALRIDLPRLTVAGTASLASGTIAADPGSCVASTGGAAVPIPALVARLVPQADGTTRIAVGQAGRERVPLMTGAIAAGRLRLAPTATGIAALPFLRGLAIDEAL